MRAAHNMAGCVYKKSSSQVRTALTTVDPEDAVRKLSEIEPRGTCSNLSVMAANAEAQQVRFPADVYRGMLAEAALRQDFSRGSLPPLQRQRVYARPWFGATTRPLVVDEMAACVADTNPAGVQALLGTTAESDEEAAAVSRIMPSLGPCLTAGATLNANRQALRAALAEALYHRFLAPSASASAAQ